MNILNCVVIVISFSNIMLLDMLWHNGNSFLMTHLPYLRTKLNAIHVIP